MYLSYYHLLQNPFQITADPRFLWLGPKHEEGLATLRYGIQTNKGFLLLTGDVGTGKTTLVNALLRVLGDDILVAVVRDPNLEALDFYNYLSHAFKLGREFTRKLSFLIHFEKFLHDSYAKKKKVLLVIDEAQRIPQELLEEVRLLSNIEREDRKLLNIFFVGQVEFNEILLRPENRPIRQRITINYNIPPLTENETGDYIQHRLEIAGAEKRIYTFAPLLDGENVGEYTKDKLESMAKSGGIFDAVAIQRIFAFSGGYPRLINIICDRCLLTGFVEESGTVTAGIVMECVEELTIPPPEKRKKPSPLPAEPVRIVPDQPAPATVPIAARSPGPAEKEEGAEIGRLLVLSALLLLLVAIVFVPLMQNNESVLSSYPLLENVKGILNLSPGRSEVRDVEHAHPASGKPADPGTASSIAISGTNVPSAGSAEKTGAVSSPPAVVSASATPAQQAEGSKTPLSADEEIANSISPAAGMNGAGNSEPGTGGQSPPDGQAAKNVIALGNGAGEKIIPSLRGKKLVISFSADLNFVSEDSLKELNTLAKTLLLRPELKIVIRGYTDAVGSENYNIKLSEFRAGTIKSYLVGKGMNESRISTLGLGSRDPVVSNDSPFWRTANRRVEIEVVP